MEGNGQRRLGVIGGLDASSAADELFARLSDFAGKQLRIGEEPAELRLERPLRKDSGSSVQEDCARKIHVFDAVLALAARQTDLALLPCFRSHAFLDEIEAEAPLRIVNMMEALHDHLVRRYSGLARIGVLTADRESSQQLFERCFPPGSWSLLYPAEADTALPFPGSPEEIQDGQENVVDLLVRVCAELVKRGAGVIIPASAEFVVLATALRERGLPVVDVLGAYAEYALSLPAGRKSKPFKIGVVGGVGPAATVDFMDKIVRNTPAGRDQEHIKVVVEQNPQIPDRTANLLNGGADPTIALYSTCRRLEADDASIIAIPCNTAHAFVEHIQPHLAIPIVNMLRETVEHIKRHCAGRQTIGLLATSGTVRSRVYHNVILPEGFDLLVPDDENQQRVMNAIYGPLGVKAGYTEGECAEDLQKALASLVLAGAEIIILGCTELPLLIRENEAFPVAGKTVMVLDPTSILARKCVSLAARGI